MNLSETNVRFVRLRWTELLRDSRYPRLTLLGQILGSMLVGLEAAFRHRPAVLVDTLGLAFVYPAFKLLTGCPILAYTHYPFISQAMIAKVQEGRIDFNNDAVVSKRPWLRALKLAYYGTLLAIYGACGRTIRLAMANSSWTLGHLKQIWSCHLIRLFPPCDIDPFIPVVSRKRTSDMVSVAQFRPEKNHALQLESFAQFVKRGNKNSRLILIGGCRDADDHARVEQLKALAQSLNVADRVVFKIDASFSEIIDALQTSTICLHTMEEEHFGIALVEAVAAGAILLAHRSGGPAADIVKEEGREGLLASTAEEYADKMALVLGMDEDTRTAIRQHALAKAQRQFSLAVFSDSLVHILKPFL